MSTSTVEPSSSNRGDLAETVQEILKVDLGTARSSIDAVVRALAAEISAGKRVELRGLGTFIPRVSKERTGRNPKKPGVPIVIKPRWSVKFRPGHHVSAALKSLPVA